jgi:threonine dehydrogenase-like Zn-dependent dehydrogenase
MKAVVFAGTRTVEVREVPDAVLGRTTDVVLRVTSSAICGTDLHMYDGRTGAEPGLVLGHEPPGVVERAGSGHPDHENPAQVIGDLARLVNPTGQAGIIGVYAERTCTRRLRGTVLRP